MFRYLYKYIFFFLLFSTSLCGFSQSVDFEDAYEPDSLFAVRNAVKYDPVQIIFGDYEIYYERILPFGFSVEAGVGFTRRDFAAGWNEYTHDNLGRNVDVKTGYAFSISLRKYLLQSEELNGPYVGVGLRSLQYETDFKVIDTTGVLTGDVFTDLRKYVNFEAVVGYQLLPMGSNFFVDVFVGVAYRNKDFDMVKSEDINIPETYYISEEKGNDYVFRFGAKVGFGF